jgi:uncharacterized membrane protein YgdD (TMEM256/DUF423 family)
MKMGHYALLAAVNGFCSVAVGAFASHGVQDLAVKALLETGARYQFMHTMASFASLTMFRWGATSARFALPFFLVGIVLFSGSLFALAAGAPRWTGMITPVGGLAFLAGWSILAFASRQLLTEDYRMGGKS